MLAHPADDFLSSKRRARLQLSAMFAGLAIASIGLFSLDLSLGSQLSTESWELRTEASRRALLAKKFSLAILEFASAAPLVAIAIRIKRLNEDAHDIREEQRIWQRTCYAPSKSGDAQHILLEQEPPQLPTRTIYETVLSSLTSRIFFGAQRTGKSYLVACVAQTLRAQGVAIFHLNLASIGHGPQDEDGKYWVGCDSLCFDLANEMDEAIAARVIERAQRLIERFKSDKPAVLIVDEWTQQCSKNNKWKALLEPLNIELANQISILTSTGLKRERAIWAIAPEFVASALTPQGISAKRLGLVYLSIAPGQTSDWNGQSIGWNAELFQCVQHNFRSLQPPLAEFSDTRIGFVDGQWGRVGVEKHTLQLVTVPTTQFPMANDQFPMPTNILGLLNWLAENRALAKEGWIRKSLVQQQFRPHRKGMESEVFAAVLSKLAEQKYIAIDERSPVKIMLLKLPGNDIK